MPKPPRKPTIHPVSSFGPELQSVLREGANKEVRITFTTPQLALRFSQRINQLRAAMRRESHRDTDQLYRAGVRISRENPCQLIIAPKDSEFRSALRDAEIAVGPPPSVIDVVMPTPIPGVAKDAADDFLATLSDATAPPDETSKKDVD